MKSLAPRSSKPIFWIIVALPSAVFFAFSVWISFTPSLEIGLFLLGIVLLILWLVIWLIVSIVLAWQEQPQPVIPFLIGLACLWPAFYFLNNFPLADDIHLAVTYPTYQADITDILRGSKSLAGEVVDSFPAHRLTERSFTIQKTLFLRKTNCKTPNYEKPPATSNIQTRGLRPNHYFGIFI